MRHVILLALLLAAPAAGQSWRTSTDARRRGSEDHLRVHVEHAAGIMRVRPAAAGQLYRLAVRYDEDAFRSGVLYRPEGSSLVVNLDSRRGGNFDWDENRQSLDLALATDVPLDLTFKFAAAKADLDLGGLHVRSLELQTGASESRLTFATPNAGLCTRMNLTVGAAQFSSTRLGNARCATIDVRAGVGELFLDFAGDYPEIFEGSVLVHMGLGELTLQFPEHVGIQLRMRRFLASVERAGLIRRGDVWLSPNWDDATRKITIDVTAVFGSVNVVRVAEPGT
jgi:hypothetical protein